MIYFQDKEIISSRSPEPEPMQKAIIPQPPGGLGKPSLGFGPPMPAMGFPPNLGAMPGFAGHRPPGFR